MVVLSLVACLVLGMAWLATCLYAFVQCEGRFARIMAWLTFTAVVAHVGAIVGIVGYCLYSALK